MKSNFRFLAIAVTVAVFLFGATMPSRALNYTISFAGTGASTSIDSVIVQNLTKGTTAKVPAGYVLNLTDLSASVIPLVSNNANIWIAQNASTGKSVLTFYAQQAGNTLISVYAIDGRKVTGLATQVEVGNNAYELSLPVGAYAVRVSGAGYAYTAKLLNALNLNRLAEIRFLNNEKPETSAPQKSKAATDGITMTYSAGDQLLYKAYSENYCTIVTDVPTDTKSTDFEFVACTDASGNNYAVVNIGGQTWMAENLKTNKYRDNIAITNVSDSTAWAGLTTGAWCNYNNDAALDAKYGKLYNWYAVDDARGLAPTGWHVPTDAEWTALETYVTAHLGSSPSVAKALAATTDWAPYSGTNNIGNDLTKNNSSGFGTLPGGGRGNNGSFYGLRDTGGWWSATAYGSNTGWFRFLYGGYGLLGRGNGDRKVGFSVRYIKDGLPIATSVITSVASTTATAEGDVLSDGGATVTARGVCWSTSPQPTTALSTKTTNGTGTGTGTGRFIGSITGLTANTMYYLRSYAINSFGTTYGNEVSFTTTTTMTDIDGNEYHTVTIGTQTWMVENLKTTRYRNGDTIPNATDGKAWLSHDGRWCDYNNDATLDAKYGKLYNWYAADRDLAPANWHVPTEDEWNTLKTYVDAHFGSLPSGAKALAATTDWNASSDTSAIGNDLSMNNSSGFSALPGGFRSWNGVFGYLGNTGYWWTATTARIEFRSDFAYTGNLYHNFSSVLYQNSSIDKLSGLSVRCIRNVILATAPTLTTTTASGISSVAANTGGNITSDGGAPVTARGVCWSTSPQPTVALSTKTVDGRGDGSFTSSITKLTPNTTYYVRAYATNGIGTAYSDEVSFITLNTVTDIDGNVYATVKIGTQTWMAENLKTTRYRNGTAIPNVTNEWSALTTGAYCDFNANSAKYGKRYNWYAVADTRNIAPTGWHVATDAEWSTLETYVAAHLGYSPSVAKALAATTDWPTDSGINTTGNDLTKNNSSSFGALPGGFLENNGVFFWSDYDGRWWSATAESGYAWYRGLNHNNSDLDQGNCDKRYGFSVRCVKD